jgi:hypothetical protein
LPVGSGRFARRTPRHKDGHPDRRAHTIIFAEDAEAARAFFRDVFSQRGPDDGWLSFVLRTG